ncbi:MAG: hypothetical protein LBC25_00035, partial [Holosporales bacterium]|nr:hypothetical protein [Holosporales bacterium]
SPSVTEVPNVVGREVSDLSPSVIEVPNVVGREVPAPSPSVTEVPNVVGREVPAPSPSVIEVPPPAVEDTLSAMNREREDQPPSAHLLRFAELLELTIGKNFPTLEGDIIKFGKERIVESRLIDSGDKKRILMCNWMEALAELKQKKVYEIPPDVLTKLPMQDLITDVGYSLAALMLKTSKKIQDKLAKEAKAFQRESGDVIPVSVSGVYGLVFESPVHYTRIIKDRSLKIYQFIIDENTRFRTIARNRPDLAYTLEDVRCGMSEFLEEAGRALGYPDQNTITAEQLISPVFKFPKPIPALTRDDVLQTLMRNIRRIS